MLEEKKQKSLSWGVIITGAALVLVTLGGLIWFFLTSVK